MNPNIEFIRYESKAIDDSPLSNENLSTTKKHGFLGWVSPHLYFGDFNDGQLLPRLKNWSWIEDWKADKELALEKYGDMVVIGSGPDNEPIVLNPNQSPVYILSSNLELVSLASNLESLVAIASAFMDMVDKAFALDPDAIQNCCIPIELVNEFVSILKTVEDQYEINAWLGWAKERSKNL